MRRIETTDLFGERVVVNVSEAKRPVVQPKGYASAPGTGPADETCASCTHARRFGRYAKCELLRHHWTGGQGTDIKLRTPACQQWAAKGCHASSDGDCSWAHCPQIRDGEPEKSGRNCPLDEEDEE